ncbi:DUF2892 domain-containing protein [Cryomorphaceae bacterium]|nr:DUF2892 domain-containing protein [Cryomorphaceae bacterium]
MIKNMGAADRIIRLIVSAVLIYLAYTGVVSGLIATIFYILSGVFIVTSLVRTCPLYMPFGISTCKTKEA